MHRVKGLRSLKTANSSDHKKRVATIVFPIFTVIYERESISN